MVFELLAGAGEAIGATEVLDAGYLASEAGTFFGSGLVMSAGAGGMAGILAGDATRAGLYSALAGAGVAMLHRGTRAPDKLVLSMLTSTSVGLIANYFKNTYTSRIQQPRDDAHPSR